MENEVYQLEQVEKRVRWRQAQGKSQRAGDADALARLGRLRDLAAEVRHQRAVAETVEDEAIVTFLSGVDEPPRGLGDRFARVAADWDGLLFRLYAANRSGADRVTLVLFSEFRAHLAELADAYRTEAEMHRLQLGGRVYVTVAAEEADAVLKKGKPPRFAKSDEPVTAWADDHLWQKTGSALVYPAGQPILDVRTGLVAPPPYTPEALRAFTLTALPRC